MLSIVICMVPINEIFQLINNAYNPPKIFIIDRSNYRSSNLFPIAIGSDKHVLYVKVRFLPSLNLTCVFVIQKNRLNETQPM